MGDILFFDFVYMFVDVGVLFVCLFVCFYCILFMPLIQYISTVPHTKCTKNINVFKYLFYSCLNIFCKCFICLVFIVP